MDEVVSMLKIMIRCICINCAVQHSRFGKRTSWIKKVVLKRLSFRLKVY